MTLPAAGGEAAPPGSRPPRRLADLGSLAARRPPVSLVTATAGVGGALAAAGAVAVAGERWAATGSGLLAVAVTGVVLAGGVAAMARAASPVAEAGVAAAGIAAPAVAFFVSAGGGLPAVREVALLAGVLLATLYLVGPGRGHTFHLTILAVAGWLFAVSLGDLGADALVSGVDTVGDLLTGAGLASTVLGVGYLAAGRWLHAAGLEGMATPFLGVGCLALPAGALAAVRDSGEVGGGAIALAAGAGVAVVGARCGRRGTTWTGVAVAAAGAIALVSGIAPDDVAAAGLLLSVIGAALVVLAPVARVAAGEPAVDEPGTGDGVAGRAVPEERTPPPPSVGGA